MNIVSATVINMNSASCTRGVRVGATAHVDDLEGEAPWPIQFFMCVHYGTVHLCYYCTGAFQHKWLHRNDTSDNVQAAKSISHNLLDTMRHRSDRCQYVVELQLFTMFSCISTIKGSKIYGLLQHLQFLILTSHLTESTPLNRSRKIVTVDYHGETSPCAKYGANSQVRELYANGWKITF